MELGEVAIPVVEVNTDIGMVGIEVTSLLRPISMHVVVGEADAIVTDTESGHGVVEEIKQVVVVSVANILEKTWLEKFL